MCLGPFQVVWIDFLLTESDLIEFIWILAKLRACNYWTLTCKWDTTRLLLPSPWYFQSFSSILSSSITQKNRKLTGGLAQIWYSGRDDHGQAQNFWRIRVWHTDGVVAPLPLSWETRPPLRSHWPGAGLRFLIGQKCLSLLKLVRWLDAESDNQMVVLYWRQFIVCIYKWCHERMIACSFFFRFACTWEKQQKNSRLIQIISIIILIQK